jgi:hypothetical protein
MHVALSDEGVSQAGLRRMISNQSYWTYDNVATKKSVCCASSILSRPVIITDGHRCAVKHARLLISYVQGVQYDG